MTKKQLFKTAQALIGCAHFAAGDFVKVSYMYDGDNGIAWYLVNDTVAYPSHHLSRFCL